jgi:hypothetical protein
MPARAVPEGMGMNLAGAILDGFPVDQPAIAGVANDSATN